MEDPTYYGLRAMCEDALEMWNKYRIAVDPASGNSVDEASAVIGTVANGRVYYFEDEDNLRAFKPSGGV